MSTPAAADPVVDRLRTQIEEANREVVKRLTTSALILDDIAPAGEVVPFFKQNPKGVLHAGPPIEWTRMCGAMQGAIVGMVLVEGWASTVEDAYKLMASGAVKTGSANENSAVGPMSGVISPSMPVFVILNRTFGNRSVSRPADLHQQFGNYKDLTAIRLWRDTIAPTMRIGLKALGKPLELGPMLQSCLEMGDELHNRITALTNLLVNELTFGLLKQGIPHDAIVAMFDFSFKNANGPRLALGLAMAAAQATLEPATKVEYSTVLTCMSRNGVDWGVRVSSMHPQWFVAPAPTCHKYYIFPPYTREDFGNDMGDSVITETNGWGGLIAANSLALAYVVGATPEEAFEISRFNQKLVIAENPQYKIPAFGYRGAPCGIDLRQIAAHKQGPVINTGIAHKDAGHSVVARGLLHTPMLCFEKALAAYCTKYAVTQEQLVATLKPAQ